MSQPYVGEIRMFGGTFAPAGWMFCNGQQLSINEYSTLFNLIGTTYGGDGQTNFHLPDLRGRLPIHQGTGFTLGANGGVENVTLTVPQIPAHTHPLQVSTNGAQQSTPAGNVTGQSGSSTHIYRPANPGQQMAANACGSTGGSDPHSNFQPYLCVNFIIAMIGVYPSPT